MRDTVQLPHDLFLLILKYLPPSTLILCRGVSSQWHAAFTDPDTSLRLLRWNYPRCREFRLLDPDHTTYATTFALVARRYHNLRRGRPHAIETLPLAGPADGLSFRGVATWNRYIRRGDKTCDFHYPDPVWSYSQHDALLVYPRPSPSSEGRLYYIYDPATGHHLPVPFDVRGKHIRRVRLAHGVLIFEWAEAFAYHQLNDREFVHRHFVTAFNVSPAAGTGIEVTFLSEWKLHFLGLPLNRSDRFFSVHNSTHYAAYIWQPNRSLYNDDPIEQLAVWDLSSLVPAPAPSPSPTPPAAPAGTGLWTAPSPPQSVSPQPDEPSPPPHPEDAEPAPPSLPEEAPPQPEEPEPAPPSLPSKAQETKLVPLVIRRLSWRDLSIYHLRQGNTPKLRELRLDAHNVYFVEEEHSSADGQHSSQLTSRALHMVRCTGVPFASSFFDGVVHGPAWVDECDGLWWLRSESCRGARHLSEEEGFTRHYGGEEERLAPCWRHNSCPTLTVARVVDEEAGVVVEAMMRMEEEEGVLELWLAGLPFGTTESSKRADHGYYVRNRGHLVGMWQGGMWGSLMGKGRMEGDERWLLGEAVGGGVVTILRF